MTDYSAASMANDHTGRWRPTSRTFAEAAQWRRRQLESAVAVFAGGVALAFWRMGRAAFVVIAAGLVLGLVVGVAWPWWRRVRDRRFSAKRPEAAYAGAASIVLEGVRRSEYLRDPMSTVRWARLGRTIGASGMAGGALYVDVSGVSWSPAMHAWRKGFRDFTVPWDDVASVELLPDRLWHHPSALVLTVHNGDRLTLRDVDAGRLHAALSELDDASPGLVPPARAGA